MPPARPVNRLDPNRLRKGSFERLFSKDLFRTTVSDMNEEPGRARIEEQGGDPFADLHQISDARELRALAHPVRLHLYELLALHRSLTATQASRIVGGSPTSVAYHLRTLAKYGYVEEAEGGTGRERPWRVKTIGYSFSDNDPNPETKAAANALSRQLFRRWLERREAFVRNREQWPPEVRKATGEISFVLFGTPEELAELRSAWGRLTEKYMGRIKDPELRPEHSQPFELQLFAHPIDVTPYEITED
jgi:DNA-binding transcriptional ArsR family regulator